MQRNSKIAIALGAALLVGAAGFATYDNAEAHGGWNRDGMHGKHGHHMHGRHGAHFAKLLERFDANGDDKLSQEELDQSRKDMIAKFDTDKNGDLSLEEYQALWLDVMHKRMVRSFQRLDSDGSAAVTSEEFLKPFSRIVQRLDRNNDGMIDQQDRARRWHHRRDRDQDRQGDENNAPQQSEPTTPDRG